MPSRGVGSSGRGPECGVIRGLPGNPRFPSWLDAARLFCDDPRVQLCSPLDGESNHGGMESSDHEKRTVMKRTIISRSSGVLRFGLLGALAASGIFATTAAAGEYNIAGLPELGRCVKVARHMGGYANKKCVRSSPVGKPGSYAWEAGPGTENKFAGILDEPEPVLETVGKAKISCSSGNFNGEYLNGKEEKMSISLQGCASGTKPCQSDPAKAGVIEGEAEAHLGFISGAGAKKPNVGWDITKEGTIFTYECGSVEKLEVPVLSTVDGSVIGLVKPYDVMTEEFLVKFTAAAGKQEPEKLEGGVPDVLSTDTLTADTNEQTGLTATDEQESGLGEIIEKPANQEPLEIKARCTGPTC
jgi:hypothetical protein